MRRMRGIGKRAISGSINSVEFSTEAVLDMAVLMEAFAAVVVGGRSM